MKFTRLLLAALAVTAMATPNLLARPVAAPEIDPSLGAGTLALIAGAIMIIRGRARAN